LPLSILVALPDRALVDAWLCDCLEKFVLNCGAQNDFACATP
jgi:hypothetical protein